MTNCSSRTQIAAKKGGKNSAAVPLAAMTNTLCSLVLPLSTSPAHKAGRFVCTICWENGSRAGLPRAGQGQSWAPVAADPTPGYVGTSTRGCGLGGVVGGNTMLSVYCPGRENAPDKISDTQM